MSTHTAATPGRGCAPTLPVDLDGYPYQVIDYGREQVPMRLTRCCHAVVTYFDSTLVCRGCYEDADPATDAEAHLDATWQPPTGPIVIRLPRTDTP